MPLTLSDSAGLGLTDRAFGNAAAFYLVAVTCLVAMLREASRAGLEDVDEDEATEPGWWRRWQVAREARAIVRAETCTCDAAWWPSPTRPHAPRCRAAKNGSQTS
ncbi:hypothetical protein [Streptomyces salinarius]|uniref:hypothetical protein n=1 Tax=Streptomyces salinarius TaxID=2762598 RepID=UPI002852D25D|nr:hypothetical protein [Streptomyces salinarius]